MNNMCRSICIVCAIVLFSACNRYQRDTVHARLQQWDACLEKSPEAIGDSLTRLNPQELSDASRAYYGLLKTIADDKNYIGLDSDSLINSVVRYYKWHAKNSNNHIRALIYQGVVRTRMGDEDSTAYIPLKEAIGRIKKQKYPDETSLYFANYYLGNVNKIQRNYLKEQAYLQETLKYARIKNNPTYLFDTYLALYWNAMKQKRTNQGKHYLDTLQQYTHTPQQRYYLLNAQSVYCDIKKEYAQSLQKEKEQMHLLPFLKEKPEYFKIYYSISDGYYNLNRLDSAMFYAKKSIEHITDSTYRLNYMLYEHAAAIAERKEDYPTANFYRKEAAKIHKQTIKKETDKHILELEKKYDLSEAQNKALQWEEKAQRITFLLFCLLIGFFFIIIYVKKRKEVADEKAKKLEMEKELADAKNQMLETESSRKGLIQNLYIRLLEQCLDMNKRMTKMAAKSRKENPQISDAIDEMQHDMRENFRLSSENAFSDEDFEQLTGLNMPQNMSNAERLILFLLLCNTSNKEIAAILGTSENSFRSRKNLLKIKLSKQGYDTSFF